MKTLSQDAFQRSREFLKTKARSLDCALFDLRFEKGSPERVIEELAAYQNEDGGFHGLEPDLRTPSSSAIATGIGLGVLKEAGCSATHPMVQKTVQFLLETFDETSMTWRVAPLDTHSFPHASWWHDEGGSLARAFHDFCIIPRAEIVALLHHFSADVPPQWLSDVTAQTVSDIETNLPSDFGDELRYALRLVEVEAVPGHFRDRLLPVLQRVVPSMVDRDPNRWHKYCTPPLWIAPLPHSALADILEKDVEAYLNYQIEHQTSEGTWEPFWTWGNDYAEAWEQAKLEWRGHLTLETLTSLQAFDRIE